MATITFPSEPAAQAVSWTLVQPAQTNVSQWTGQRQTLASNRGWWECEYTLPPIVGTTNANPWRSFLAKTQGQTNDFQVLVDPVAQSSASATPLVNGAGQTGRSLVTDGWPLSTTVLYAGQYVTIGNQLLQLTADVVSDGTGAATISFEPPIRVSPANNTAIEFKNPYCLMYLKEKPAISVEAGYVYSLSLSLRESF